MYSELSQNMDFFLILFEKLFLTPRFLTYTTEKKSQFHDFSPT